MAVGAVTRPGRKAKAKSVGAAQSPLLGFAMFSPAVLYILLLIGLPFCLAIFYAFSDARIGTDMDWAHFWRHWVGWNNFRSIMQSPSFRAALKNSIIFTVAAQIIMIVCSTMLAIALDKPFRGRGLVRFLILLPWVAPVSLGTIGWKWILDSIYSVITWVLVWLGFVNKYSPPMWLGQEGLAITSVILVHCWRLIPFSTVILLAGQSAIPKEIPEAAAIDGAGFWRTLFQINLPMMTPLIGVAVLFGTVFTFTDLAVVNLLTNGGPYDSTQTLPNLAFTQGIQGSDLAAGAAISVFLVPVLVAIAYLMLRVAHRAEVV
jgi:multiple sugar transport system permease protein